ncbi:MAG: glycosyltransferase family 39 protein [Vicinamibacteria bacterium]
MPLWTLRRLMALLAATVGSRVVVAAFLGVTGYPQWWEYDVIAYNISHGLGHAYDRVGFTYLAYSPPVWSYILAVLRLLPGLDHLAIQAFQTLCCFVSAAMFGGIGRQISGDEHTGLMTGFVVALQPSLLYYSVVKSDPLPLNCLLLGMIILAGLALLQHPDPRLSALFGLLLALGVLSRGTPIVALPVISLALWRRHGLPRAALHTMIAIAFLAMGLAPWLVRNQRLIGRALITSTAGENFWRGNHEGATGGVVDVDGGLITTLIPSNEALPDSVRGVLRNGTEVDRQDVFMNEGLEFVVHHPGDAAALFARKMRTFWWRIDSDPSDYSSVTSAVYEIVYRIELALALVGLTVIWRGSSAGVTATDREAGMVVLGIMLAVSVLQSAFYVQGRHRFLIEPILMIFTAAGLSWLGTCWTRRRDAAR